MIQNTRLAKWVYWLSGQVSRVKLYKQTYVMANQDEWLNSTDPEFKIEFEPAGRMWNSISLTWKLLSLANRMDREHFEHWALKHSDDCAAVPCTQCKGEVCTLDDEDEGADA